MTFFPTGIHDLAEWRKRSAIARRDLAAALGVAEATVARWERGTHHPAPPMALRLTEMMRADAPENLALAKLMVSQSRNMSALFDFSGVRLMCASLGLVAVWPNFCAMAGVSFLAHLTDEALHLMADAGFVRDVRQGRILGVSGVSDRHVTLDTDPAFRHRWTAMFRAYGPVLVAELTYQRCDPRESVGLEGVVRLDRAEGIRTCPAGA